MIVTVWQGRTRSDLPMRLGRFSESMVGGPKKRQEPNNRPYDPAIERELRRLEPEELDRIIHGEDDARLPNKISK